MDTVSPPNKTNRMTREQRRKVLAGSLGNAVEYIDWAIYAALVPVFSVHFFPEDSGGAAILGALIIFAVGFVMRPVGGAVIGTFADRRGRKSGLALSILLMSTGAFLIAFAPTYKQIGIFAPVILLIARLLQGFAAGGEYGTSSAYLVEAAAEGRRGFAGSFQQFSITAGILGASGLSYLVTNAFDDEFVSTWGWRIGFAVAAALGLVVLWYRTRVGDSDTFESMKDNSRIAKSPVITLLRDYKTPALWVFIIVAPVSLFHYIWVVYMPAFANASLDLPLSQTLIAQLISLVFLLVMLPWFGVLSDRFGRKPMLITSCAGNLAIAYPGFLLVGQGFLYLLGFQLLAVFFLAPYLASLAATMAEKLPPEVRTTGIGLPYAISVGIFGGTAPYIITAMKDNGLLQVIWIYPALMAVVAIVCFAVMEETAHRRMD